MNSVWCEAVHYVNGTGTGSELIREGDEWGTRQTKSNRLYAKFSILRGWGKGLLVGVITKQTYKGIKVIYVNMATRQGHAHLVFGPKVLFGCWLKFTLVTLINENQYHLPYHIHFIFIPIAIGLVGKQGAQIDCFAWSWISPICCINHYGTK